MGRNRLNDYLQAERPATAAPRGLVLYPVSCQAVGFGSWSEGQRQLYHWAYEQALAVVRPSILEGRLAPSWN